ncbi:hypothetical protein [Vibrio coralliilyticus]|uniref:hypothetical protein n=1 Tax=Vibrio coralliilyticus TaxID=190893 RepID=UPI0002D696DA|nr:hypothetical protein [Vibrio coralliilyticus]
MGIQLVKSSQQKLLNKICSAVKGGETNSIVIKPLDKKPHDQNRVSILATHYELMFDEQTIEETLCKELGNLFRPKRNEQQHSQLFELLVRERLDNIFEYEGYSTSELNYFEIFGDVKLIVGLSDELLSKSFLQTYSSEKGKAINIRKLISMCEKKYLCLDFMLTGFNLSVDEVMSLEVGHTISSDNLIKDGLSLSCEGEVISNSVLISASNNKTKMIVG